MTLADIISARYGWGDIRIDRASPERLWCAYQAQQEEQREENRRTLYIGWEASGRSFNLQKRYEELGLAERQPTIEQPVDKKPTAQERIEQAQSLIKKMRERSTP